MRSENCVSRKERKGRKEKTKYQERGRGLCELGVLGARKFLEVVLSNILDERI